MYVQIKSGVAEYYSLDRLRPENPNVSFPSEITDEIAAEFGVYPCKPTLAPTISYTQNVEVGPPKRINGAWTQTWVVTDASPQDVAARVEGAWEGVRADRNARLADCDWTQLGDAPVDKVAWATYRQQLRDITTQSDPFNIEWPLPPA